MAKRQRVKDTFFGRNRLVRLGMILRSLIGNVYNAWFKRVRKQEALLGKRWLIVGSRNQESALTFLQREEQFVFVRANVYFSLLPSEKVDWYVFPKVFYLWKYVGFFFRAWRRNSTHFWMVIYHLFHGCGALENNRKVLREYRPELIVISNDHQPWFRALVVAARELNIPTVYIQHACVVDDFPSLTVDLALLDGQDALDKYLTDNHPPSGEALLIGMPKYDEFRHRINHSTAMRRLGFPYGFFDDPMVLSETVAAIQDKFPEVTITLRKHPRDTRPFPMNDGLNIKWSDSKQESALDFLARQDAIVSSESSIHLEATLLNVTSLFYQFQKKSSPPLDHYGFIANGLIVQYASFEALVEALGEIGEKREVVIDKASYYVANLKGAKGKGREMAIRAIKELLDASG